MTHQYTKLADDLRTIAYKAPDKATNDTIFEAARILRAAAAVDVRGLMAMIRAFGNARAREMQSPVHDNLRETERSFAALESALRLALAAREGKLWDELEVTEKLLTQRERVLQAIPECPQHGAGCVPHALEWIERAIAAAAPKGTP